MVERLKIGKLSIVGVIRHRWEKKEESTLDYYFMWKDYRIGFWFRKLKSVGSKNFNNPSKWGENLRGTYMFGFDFIFIKMWVSVNYGVMHLGV